MQTIIKINLNRKIMEVDKEKKEVKVIPINIEKTDVKEKKDYTKLVLEQTKSF